MSELNYSEWEQRLQKVMGLLMDIAQDTTLNDLERDDVSGLLVRLNAAQMILDVYRATMYAKHLKDERKVTPTQYKAYEVPDDYDLETLFPGITKLSIPPRKKNDDDNQDKGE